ncbi:MAG: LytTR family DNA-binding domain-containing protein [Parvularculaceae bacterium]
MHESPLQRLPSRVLPYAWVGALAAALVAQCSYCLVMQSLGNGLNARAFWLWFVSNPTPLVTAAGAASFLFDRKLQLIGLAALAALFVVASDLAAFPPDEFSAFNVLKRAQDKTPTVAIYVALGASLYALRRRGERPVEAAPAPPTPLLSAVAIRAAGNYVEALSAGSNDLIRLKLRDAAEALSDHGYLRVHRSWIVKLDAVAEVVRDREGLAGLILSSGVQAPVGRSYRAAVRAALEDGPVVRH